MKIYTCEKCAKQGGCAVSTNSVSTCKSFISYGKAAMVEANRRKLRLNKLLAAAPIVDYKKPLTFKPFTKLNAEER